MGTLDRRTFLAGSAGLAGLASLAACGGSSGSGSKGSPAQWWEGSKVIIELDRKVATAHKAELGDVKLTFYGPKDIGQSLQLAHNSKQMPDLTIIAGLGVPLAQLITDGWFQPLEMSAEATKRLDGMALYDGMQIFDGKVYSFPVFTASTNTITWYHPQILEKAGLDPASPPKTYDEFRAACRKLTKSGKAGLLLPLKVPTRNTNQTNIMAQAAGFAGQAGQLFTTGEFAYHSDEYVNYIEFLKALEQDGSMFKGNLTLDVKSGQARWAAGGSAFFLDGPWIPGNIKVDYPQLQGKVGAGPMLVPDSSQQPTLYVSPAENSYFIPAGAKHADVANKIMALLATEEYQIAYCGVMGQLPRDAEAIDKSDADPVWKEVAKRLLSEVVFRAPSPVIGNLDVVKVDSALKPVNPDLGTIIQGYFSGDVTDLRASLKKLSDASAKALETAIKTATAKGAKVSMDDYAFPNWKPRAHYTPEMYK